MNEKLFVYGTLGLGRPNEHILTDIGGSWEVASVRGVLRDQGWGAEMGYPGIELNEAGEEIKGFVFTSENLSNHWANLDEFESQCECLGLQGLDNDILLDCQLSHLR